MSLIELSDIAESLLRDHRYLLHYNIIHIVYELDKLISFLMQICMLALSLLIYLIGDYLTQ